MVNPETAPAASPSRESWKKTHGDMPPVAYTEIHTPRGAPGIVSTVVCAGGHTFQGGFFRVFETRAFGEGLDLEAEKSRSLAEAIASHARMFLMAAGATTGS